MALREPDLPPDVRADWAELASPTERPAAFDPASLSALPAPARRWLTHAIAPGTPLHRSAELITHGQIRIGRWASYSARWRLAPPDGFVWAAAARVAGVPITGFDRYTRGSGQMHWRLLGRLPVLSAEGTDVTRSAAGRLAGEFVFCPAAALSPAVSWEPLDEYRAVACFALGGFVQRVTLRVAASGALESVRMRRWGNPDGDGFAEYLFGADITAEESFAGFTVPSRARVGWHYGTDRWAKGEFFRLIVDSATYR
jgi:hypothetical protein